MDTLKAMRLFVRVAQTRNFRKVADEANLPAPTVTLAVQELERALDTRLLHRTTRSVSLTSDGELLLPRIIHMVDEWETLASSEHSEVKGLVRLDAPTRMARLFIIPHLPELLERYHTSQVEIRSTTRPVDLVAEGIDIAIRVGALSNSGLFARLLGNLTLISCASPEYLHEFSTPKTIEELQQHFAVQYASPTTGKIAPWEYTLKGKTHTISVPARVTVNSAETYVSSAVAGLGLIQVPEQDVLPHELNQGTLIEVLAEFRPATMPIHAVYTHRAPSSKIRVVMDWLQSILMAEA